MSLIIYGIGVIIIITLIITLYHILHNPPDPCPFDSEWVNRSTEEIIIPPQSERILTKMTLYKSSSSPQKQKIPKRIIQTNEADTVPKDMVNASHTIIRDNPEYEYIYYNNKRARDYLIRNYSDRIINAYDKLIPGAYKADLFRYCYLFKEGGVYIDMGMVSKRPLREFICYDDTFLSPEDNHTGGLYNAFIASTSNHPIIAKAIELCLNNIERGYYGNGPLDITGPQLLAKSFRKIYRTHPEKDGIYGNGVRILDYHRPTICTAGKILDGHHEILATRYATYHIDRKWYNSGKHYSELWKERKVYKE